MIEFSYKNNDLVISNKDKKTITFSPETKQVLLDGYNVTKPGEFEKSGMLLEVKEYHSNLYYSFSVDGNHLVIITEDNFELKEEILEFFWDVDVLIIVGTKEAVKKFENIEAKLVIPYGEGKDIFLNTLGQSIEEGGNFKLKHELHGDTTEFVNLG